MIIADFKYEHQKQGEESTSQFRTPHEVIRFAADMSLKYENFEIERINEYKSGRLVPMEIAVDKGRITLVPKVEPMDDNEARMRMIAEAQSKIPGKIHNNPNGF